MLGLATRAQCLLGIPAFVFIVITCSPHAGAQEVDAPLDLELPAKGISGELDESNSADFDTRTVGRRKRWQLDSGHIDSEAVTPRLRESESDTSYSGIRLRRPRKK